MSELYHFYWIILLVIAAACILKIGYTLIMGEGNSEGGSSGQADRGSTVSAVHSTQITETGPMIYFANNPHNLPDCEYHFNFKKERDSWRAYILQMPNLRGRDPNLHYTHRFTDGEGTYWVCWDTPVAELSGMQAIARCWADSVLEYIATGERFG